ncbi:hypothetical protein LCGC14_2612540, partial [marine sediment metagenome]
MKIKVDERNERNIVRYVVLRTNQKSETSISGLPPENARIDILLEKNLVENTKLEYFLEVERLMFSSITKPVQIFRIQAGFAQADINLGTYSVTMQLAADVRQEFVIYTPQNLVELLPKPPSENLGLQDFSNTYYLVTSIDLMLEMINTAFTAAFNALNPVPPNATVPPFLILGKHEGEIDLIVQNDFITDGIILSVNSALWPLLSALPYRANIAQSSVVAILGQDYVLTTRFDGSNSFNLIVPGLAIPAIPQFVRMQGEFIQINSWDRIERIELVTSLNVVPEYSNNVNSNNKLVTSHVIFNIQDFRVINTRNLSAFGVAQDFGKNIFISNLGVYRIVIQIE